MSDPRHIDVLIHQLWMTPGGGLVYGCWRPARSGLSGVLRYRSGMTRRTVWGPPPRFAECLA
jgi:hypothetical protein